MKTITIGNLTLELTNERKRRITEALIETQRKLDKELEYSKDLQKQDMIDDYRTHIARLENMLA
jgi:hypothetical protein